MIRQLLSALAILVLLSQSAQADSLSKQIQVDYNKHLGGLFDYFHRNPELSSMEKETAARLATELSAAGFDVTAGVGGTGIVAIMKNGSGPLVMMRADMDGLPVQEKTGLSYASTAKRIDWDGNEV
jgi:metal-dependent amidase/aminoacylase/carboxypeptidase family protein